MNTENIVIVGGGSAGWMTATTFVKLFPEFDVTLIESPDIEILPVFGSKPKQYNSRDVTIVIVRNGIKTIIQAATPKPRAHRLFNKIVIIIVIHILKNAVL